VYDVETTARVLEAAVEPVLADVSGSRLPWSGDGTAFGVAFVSEAIMPAVHATLTSRPVPPMAVVEVPNVLSVSDAIAIYAIALGADGVLLASDPDRATEPVTDAVRQANQALADLGVGEPVAVTDTTDPDAIARTMEELLTEARAPVATEAVDTRSRHALGMTAAASLAGESAGAVAVPGSGTVTVEAAGCTLCSTCHDVCPTGALEQTPGSLDVDPGACVGCGHCETACPEDVLTVTGTVSFEDGAVPEPETIVAKESVECAVCGEPFASKAGLDAMRDRLDEAALEGLELTVCPSCRTERQAELEFGSAGGR
jgi:ferredoxin